MPAHNLDDIDERDLSEAPRLAKDSESKGVVIAMATAAVLFIGLLVYSSFPELSPEEIISMDGYEGEQPTKTIFNIHSFEDDADEKTAAIDSEQSEDRLPPIAVTEPVEPAETTVVEANPVTEAIEAEPVVEAELPIAVTEPVVTEPAVDAESEVDAEPAVDAELPIAVTEPVAVVEPVVETAAIVEPVAQTNAVAEDTPSRVITFSSASDEKVVAAMATTPTIDEAADTVVVASVAAIEPIPIPVGVSSQQSIEINPNTSEFLPLRSVLQDATELKATPSTRSKTLLTLKAGEFVTAFESDGEWIHIGINDGSSITGYVLDSALEQPAR